jgi:hypothetical protein
VLPKTAAPKPAPPAKTPKKAQKPAPSPPPVGGKMPARRADFGAPIDGFFAKQPPHLRAILEALRELVEEAAPDATASLKWGMPFYTLGRNKMMCALAGFKSHVNLILAGPPDAFADPDGLLEGDAKTGRHLKLRTLDELPREAVRGWLRTASQVAREKAL